LRPLRVGFRWYGILEQKYDGTLSQIDAKIPNQHS